MVRRQKSENIKARHRQQDNMSQSLSVCFEHCSCSVAKSCQTLCNLMNCGTLGSLFTLSWSLLKLVSIESVMPSSQLILSHSLLLLPSVFPVSGSFPMSQLFTAALNITGTK